VTIQVARDGLRHLIEGRLSVLYHRAAYTLCHPRTGACVEVLYAGHGIHDASTTITVALYAMLFIVALAHLIWVHME
jgi:hypothetical protein